jgi:diguanylate cyclase (GGDEF)-like protein
MQKIAILYDASQAVLSTFELDEVLAEILGIVRDYFQMQNAAILLVDRAHNELYVKTHFGRAKLEMDVRQGVGQGIIGTAARLKRPLYVPDVRKDPRYIERFPETRSELAIPLMVRDEVVGVLDLQSEEVDFFDNETIDLLTLFSTQASIALENARLYSLEQRRAKQLEAINAIARQTTAVTDVDELLNRVCVLLLENFVVDQVAVLLNEDGQLRLRAQRGTLSIMLQTGSVLPEGSGLSWQALEGGKSVICSDVRACANYLPGCKETLSEICVPLIFFGRKIGVLSLERAIAGDFEADEIKTIEAVADICAGAIQNANVFEQTKQLAYKDGLTGIFNRRYFEMRIAEELERSIRYGTSMAVVMLDIDHFKRLNDEFGHLLGDEVLKQVSNELLRQVRKGDLVTRFGGEEFAILLPQTNGDNAMEAAEKLRRSVAEFHFPGVPRPVTISAGIGDFPHFGKTRDEIVSAADEALYAAKQAGRNRVMMARGVKRAGAVPSG